MRNILAVIFAVVFAMPCSYAANESLTKTRRPGSIVLVKDGTAFAMFGLNSVDIPRGTYNKTRTLRGIDWSTTSYPDNTGETVELCYYRPDAYNPVDCIAIAPNSSGATNVFNNQPFGVRARVMIRHRVNGGQQPGLPAGEDSVTFHYSY